MGFVPQKIELIFKKKFAVIVVFILTFCCALITPAVAQQKPIQLPDFSLYNRPIFSLFESQPDRVAVTIDGREIFQVEGFTSDNESITAQQRATQIEQQLQNAVESDEPPQLKIEQINGLPTISLNDNYLFTVTGKETNSGKTPIEEAQQLERKIRNSLIQAQQERNTEDLYQQYINAAIIFAIAIICHRILSLLKFYSLAQACQKLLIVNPKELADKKEDISFLTNFKIALAQITLWTTTAYIISDLFPQTRLLRYQFLTELWGYLNAPLFSLGNRSYSIISLLILLALFFGLIYITKNFTQLLKSNILNRTSMSRGSQEVIFVITQYGLLALGTIILLQLWGVNLSSLTILGSAFGVGIGFGFQDIAKNFASGLVLLFERSVQVGDFIEVNEHKGTVERVGARSIVLRTLDRVSIIVPNSSLLADEVVNWTHDGSISRLQLPVGVAYGCDTQKVKSLLLKAAANNPEVLSYPAPQVFLSNFGDSSLDFQLLVWIDEPSHQAFITSELYFAIEKLLTENKIEIPFPQRDINFKDSKLGFNLPSNLEKALLEWLKKNNSKP